MFSKLKKPALVVAAFALLTPVAAMAQPRGHDEHRRSAPRIIERDHDHDRGSRSYLGFSFGPSVPRYYLAPSPYVYAYSYSPYYGSPYSGGYAGGYYDQWGYWHPYNGYYDAWGVWHWTN